MILYLVRHGETAHNSSGLGLGRDDVPLTGLGRRQAAAVAERLKDEPIERVISSPLARARDTAEAIAAVRGLPIEMRAELIELDVGVTEGLTFAAMREAYPAFMAEWAGPGVASVVMPGGESLQHVAARVDPLLREWREFGDVGVAVVSHNFVIKILLARLLGMEIASFRALQVDLVSVSTVSVHGDRVYVRGLNDNCHAPLA